MQNAGKDHAAGATRSDLVEGLASQIGVPPLTGGEIDACLALAAAAAHGTGDRTAAPLATFLAGLAAAGSGDRARTLEEIRRATTELAPVSEAR
jgi:hypothetical protein